MYIVIESVHFYRHEPAASELAPARTQEPAAAELQSAASPSVPIQQPEAPVSAVVSPPTQTPPVAQSPFPPAIPQQAQHPSQPPSQPQHSLPPSLSQSAIPVQASLQSPTPASASMSQFSHQSQASSQQTLSSHQLPQGQIQSHLHNQHQYVQHGLPTHLDPTQTQPQLSSAVPQASQQQSISPSYFRQPEAPYFHTPTPPAGQSQDTPYGSFGQLSQQVQHQAQASHLGAFSGNDYGYSENQRVCPLSSLSQINMNLIVVRSRISTIRTLGQVPSATVAFWVVMTTLKVSPLGNSSLTVHLAFLPLIPSHRSKSLPLHRLEVRHSPVLARVHSRATLPHCLTTIPTRKTSTTAHRTTLVIAYRSHTSSIRPSSKRVPLALSLHPLQQRNSPRALYSRSRLTDRVFTVNSTRRTRTRTSGTSIMRSTRMARAWAVASRPTTMASHCTVPAARECRVS